MFNLSEQHEHASSRLRRTILQFDIFGDLKMDNECDFEDFLELQFASIVSESHKIDSVFWDIMYSGDEYSVYPSKILPQRDIGPMAYWIKQGIDIYKRLLEKSIGLEIENILVHRISEVDISPNPHKAAHPDMYIKSWLWSGLHNMAVWEIRQKKLNILSEVMDNYPFDGLEIDFLRHTPFLPVGRQWEMRGHVTEFMHDLRALLIKKEQESGRPLLLSARIPETIEGCRTDGIDIWEWADMNLVDSITLGDRNFNVDIEDFRTVTKGKPIRIYPCFDGHHEVDGYHNPPLEVYRGVFANWWDRGADGIKLFNWRAADLSLGEKIDDRRTKLPKHYQKEALMESSDSKAIISLDKTFVVERKGGYPWGEGYANHNLGKPLPIKLLNQGSSHEIDIYVCDNISNRKEDIHNIDLSLTLYNMLPEDSLHVNLNGFTINETEIDYQNYDPSISAPNPAPISGAGCWNLKQREEPLTTFHYKGHEGCYIKGWNRIEIKLIRGSKYSHCQYVTLEKVEVAVLYKNE